MTPLKTSPFVVNARLFSRHNFPANFLSFANDSPVEARHSFVRCPNAGYLFRQRRNKASHKGSWYAARVHARHVAVVVCLLLLVVVVLVAPWTCWWWWTCCCLAGVEATLIQRLVRQDGCKLAPEKKKMCACDTKRCACVCGYNSLPS